MKNTITYSVVFMSALFFLFLNGLAFNRVIFRTELMKYVPNVWSHSIFENNQIALCEHCMGSI